MTEPEHSPLPWRDNGFEIRDAMEETAPIYGLDHKEVANRRLIIKAVTSHDALLAAATGDAFRHCYARYWIIHVGIAGGESLESRHRSSRGINPMSNHYVMLGKAPD